MSHPSTAGVICREQLCDSCNFNILVRDVRAQGLENKLAPALFVDPTGFGAGPIVMEEEEGSAPSSIQAGDTPVWRGPPSCSSSESAGRRADTGNAGPCHLNAAGICTGLQSECVDAAATGIRRSAQIRLTDCNVDPGRLTSAIVSGDAEQNGNSRVIRQLMRQVYGDPDQDYDDWQIVMLSDMEDGK